MESGDPAADRSIPACAGEPRGTTGGICRTRVYPRLCGGTRRRPERGFGPGGLSPPVRGNHGLPKGWPMRWRSIPACAGEPTHGGRVGGGAAVYPRLCGGTKAAAIAVDKVDGLSPPVRGNLARMVSAICFPGSIPACAGEPPSKRAARPALSVYPRLCGGTAGGMLSGTRGRGLSPPVRGNLVAAERDPADRRSIPACAGEPRGSCGVYGA